MSEQPPIKTGLLKFLRESVGSQFVIPVYQRNYTWTANKEVKQYFEDLCNVLNGKFSKHFLGILIYLDTPIDYSSREFSVIDGQQRLTTTFLILYAIKDLMKKASKNDEAEKLDTQFLTNQFVPDKLKFKLKPLVSDDEVYQQIVTNSFDEITNKTSNVYKNYCWIHNKLEDLLNKYTFNDILMSLDKLYVVCVPVSKEDSPQKIFESINSTGAKLVASDLIRNYILMDVGSETQERYYRVYWKKIEELLSNDNKKIELFFRMFLACKNLYLSNTSTVYSDFKNWYSKELVLRNGEVEPILKEFCQYAKFYNNIYVKNLGDLESGLREAIENYRENLSDMPAPFLMELYNLHESMDEEGNPLISTQQFSEIINLVNIYLVRRSICALDTSDITRLFPSILKDVLHDCNGNYANIVEYTKRNLINKQKGKSAAMPDDDALRSYLQYANVYNNRLTLRTIFNRIETVSNTAPVDLSKLSVEHLMPQTSTKEWLDSLNVDQITYDKNLHRLGNLTLASRVDNSKMKNKPWEYKQIILSNTAHLKMNQEILKNKEWTIKNIDDRTNELIDKIIELYPYQSASNDVIKKHDISIDWDGVIAFASLYEEDGSVEMQPGSEISKYSESTPDWVIDLFDDLLEDGIVKETEKGAVFLKSYSFYPQKKNSTSLSISASLILGGNRNGWDYWNDENGKPLSQNSELKKELTES